MKLIITFLLISIAISISAQKMPHEFSTRAVDGSYLKTKEGIGFQANYSVITKKGRMNLYGLSWDNAKLDNGGTVYNTYSLQTSQLYNILNKKNSLYVNIGGGGFLSYETAQNEILNKSKSKFSPGAKAKFECEYYIKGKIALFIGAEELYRPLSIIGDWQWRASIGLRYIIK